MTVSQTVKEGVYFSPPRLLNLVSEYHNLVLTFNASVALENIGLLRRAVFDSLHAVPKDNAFAQHYTAQLKELSSALTDKEADFRAFLETLNTTPHTHRRKRNLAGQVVATLFGLPTDEEIQNIVQQINTHEEKEKKVINKAISSLEVTNTQVARLTSATKKARLALMALRGHFKKIDAALANVSTNLVLVETLDFLEFAGERAINEINRIINLIERIQITAKVPPELLKPEIFKEILNMMQNKNIKLIYASTNRFVPTYYRIAEATIKLIGNIFYVIVRIPLKTEEEYLLYRNKPLWVPYNSSRWARKVTEVGEYIAVRRDKKVAIELDNLKTCVINEDNTLCAPRQNTIAYTTPTCLLTLLKDDPPTVCDYKYTTNMKIQFIKLDNYWIGSVQRKTIVEEVCDDVTSSRKIILKPGINVIPVREGCKVVGETFALPKHSVRGTTTKKISVVFPPYVISPSQHLNITNLEDLNLEVVAPMKKATLKFLAYTHQIAYNKSNLHAYTNTTGIIVLLFVIAVIAVVVKFRGRCCTFIATRNRGRNQPHTPQIRRVEEPRITAAALLNRLSVKPPAHNVNQPTANQPKPNQNPKQDKSSNSHVINISAAPNKPPRLSIIQPSQPNQPQFPQRPPPDVPEYLEMVSQTK